MIKILSDEEAYALAENKILERLNERRNENTERINGSKIACDVAYIEYKICNISEEQYNEIKKNSLEDIKSLQQSNDKILKKINTVVEMDAKN